MHSKNRDRGVFCRMPAGLRVVSDKDSSRECEMCDCFIPAVFLIERPHRLVLVLSYVLLGDNYVTVVSVNSIVHNKIIDITMLPMQRKQPSAAKEV
jgi:hypothetical protein